VQATVDYQAEDLKARVREITGTGADLVVDPVGGRYAEPALRSLRANGRYLVVGFAGGSIPRLPLNRILLGNRTVIGVDWGACADQDPAGNQALVADLLQHVAAGSLHPSPPALTRSNAPPRRSANSADGGSPPESWRSCPDRSPSPASATLPGFLGQAAWGNTTSRAPPGKLCITAPSPDADGDGTGPTAHGREWCFLAASPRPRSVPSI
jgi:zinc-binding dehydrogenase